MSQATVKTLSEKRYVELSIPAWHCDTLSQVDGFAASVCFEQGADFPNSTIIETEKLPRAVRVQDLPEESEVQHDFAHGLGALVVGQEVERPEGAKASILQNLERAAKGDRAALGQDGLLALVEAILEEGVNEVELWLDENGEFVQHGQRVEDAVSNAIQFHPGDHPTLHQVTRLEGVNVTTLKMLERQGYFDKGYAWFVPRMVPKGVPAQSLWKYGYFKNIAVAGGVVWKKPDGTFRMRTVFMAGAPVFEDEESATEAMTRAQLYDLMTARLNRRHDIGAMRRIWEDHGLPLPDEPEEIAAFQRGALFHRSVFEHPDEPDVDIARWYDNCLGPGHFLGRSGKAGDYLSNSRQSIANMQKLAAKRDALVDEMIPYHGKITDAVAVARLMAKLARKHAIDYVIDHPEVDALPLGRVIVGLREAYWRDLQAGNVSSANNLRNTIHKKALVNSCGYAEEPEEDGKAKQGRGNDGLDEQNASSNEGVCEIISDRCYCCPYNSDGSKRSKRLTIRARDDGSKVSCLRSGCGAWFAKDGSGRKNIGRIARKAEMLAKLRPHQRPSISNSDNSHNKSIIGGTS